jgi:hypothetical protein
MTDIPVHDNAVIGYDVACDKREIVIHTAFRDPNLRERTDIVFKDVEAYFIAGDNLNSVLFDVDEEPISKILDDFSTEFDRGVPYAWPGPFNQSLMACEEHFTKGGFKGWRISPSYGMTGFIIAKSMEFKRL